MENLSNINSYLQPDNPFYLTFHIGMHYGLRIGEVCGLEWKQIDFEEMTLEVEQQLVGLRNAETKKLEWKVGTPKSISGYRTIPISESPAQISKAAKKWQLANQLKYGENCLKNKQYDFVCKKK